MDLEKYIERKQQTYEQLSETIRGYAKLNYRQRALIKHALANPDFTYTIESHQNSHGVTYTTARSDLLELAEAGLLTKIIAGRKNYFVVPSDLESRLDK